jgi:hypothetical protein
MNRSEQLIREEWPRWMAAIHARLEVGAREYAAWREFGRSWWSWSGGCRRQPLATSLRPQMRDGRHRRYEVFT